MAPAALSSAAAYLASAPEDELLRLSAYAMLASGAAAFVALCFTTAPYGKYAPSAPWYYGCPINGKLAWVLQEAPSFLVAAGAWAAAVAAHKAGGGTSFGGGGGGGGVDPTALSPNTVLLGLYLLHYFNRSFVFPLRLRGGKPTPLVVFLMALAFCVWNGWMQSAALLRHAAYPPGYLASPRFVGGVAVFFAGMAINWHSDGILIGLRRPGETGYKIPRGGAFELVSGANFFGEIFEWAGFATAAGTLPAAAFAAFTFCNIAPRGAQHHAWYVRTFKDYPRGRRAVIPFVW